MNQAFRFNKHLLLNSSVSHLRLGHRALEAGCTNDRLL